MRLAVVGCALAIVVFLSIFGVVVAQRFSAPATAPAAIAAPERTPDPVATGSVKTAPAPAAASGTSKTATAAPIAAQPAAFTPNAAPAPSAVPAPVGAPARTGVVTPAAPMTCPYPDALGVARVVEIDTGGGPGFGFEHFKAHDFLRPGEFVLTFDDGPWPVNTPAVIDALASHCAKAIFFPIGKHATWHPEILKKVAAAGHAVGSHTWSHRDLSKKTVDEAKEEIEKGMSAVRMAAGQATAPFFRFPALRHPPELIAYLGERNVGIFSTDMDSFDFKTKKPPQVIKTVMDKLKKNGKGIVLMHDFQPATARALPELLRQLKAAGYKLVEMRPRDKLTTLAQYDEALLKELSPGTTGGRPTSSVVRTINE